MAYNKIEDTATNLKNLKILDFIVHKKGIKYLGLADKANLSRQRLRYWLKMDDMSLSMLYEIAEAQDITLSVELTPTNPYDDLFTGTIDYKGDIIQIGSFKTIYKTIKQDFWSIPELIERLKGGRLQFLAEYVVRNNKPYCTFCRQCGFAPQRLKEWMSKDDIKISWLYVIARRFNSKVKWTVSVKDKPDTKESFENNDQSN